MAASVLTSFVKDDLFQLIRSTTERVEIVAMNVYHQITIKTVAHNKNKTNLSICKAR